MWENGRNECGFAMERSARRGVFPWSSTSLAPPACASHDMAKGATAAKTQGMAASMRAAADRGYWMVWATRRMARDRLNPSFTSGKQAYKGTTVRLPTERRAAPTTTTRGHPAALPKYIPHSPSALRQENPQASLRVTKGKGRCMATFAMISSAAMPVAVPRSFAMGIRSWKRGKMCAFITSLKENSRARPAHAATSCRWMRPCFSMGQF